MRTPFALTAIGVVALSVGAAPAVAADPVETKHVYLSVAKGAPSAELIERGVRSAFANRGYRAGTVRVRLIVLNNAVRGRWNAARVAANARRAAADPRTIAYIGESNSAATAVSMPILNRAGIVQASSVSTAVSLTAPENRPTLQPTGTQTFFRSIPRDDQEAQALVNYIRTSGVTRIAVVSDGEMYGDELATYVADLAPRADIRVTNRQAITPGRTINTTAIRRSGAQAVVLAMTPTTGGIRTARTINARIPKALIFTGDAMTHDAVARHLYGTQPVMRLVTPSTHVDPKVADRLNLGTTSDPFTVLSYNAAATILDATRRASATGPATAARIRTAVFDGSLNPGLAGLWDIRPNGDGVVGVFDELRMARGRVLEPGDVAARSLRICGPNRNRLCRSTTPPRTTHLIQRVTTTAVPTAVNVESLDLETALISVRAGRMDNLDGLIERQVKEIRVKSARSHLLSDALAILQRAGQAVTAQDGSIDMGALALTDEERSTLTSAEVPLSGRLSRSEYDALLDRLSGGIDGIAATSQMDLLQLQVLINRQNEALAMVSTYMKELADSIGSVIRRM